MDAHIIIEDGIAINKTSNQEVRFTSMYDITINNMQILINNK